MTADEIREEAERLGKHEAGQYDWLVGDLLNLVDDALALLAED